MVRAYLVMVAFRTLSFFVGLNILRIKFDYFGGNKCCEAQDLIYTLFFRNLCSVQDFKERNRPVF